MKRFIIGLVLVTLLVGSFACASAPAGVPPSEDVPVPRPAPAMSIPSIGVQAPAPVINIPRPAPTPAPAPAPAPTKGGTDQSSNSGVEYSDIERMIVRTGNMQLVVEDVLDAIKRVTTLAEGMNGYVVSSSSWREGERLRGVITIRVPAERFAEAMGSVGGLAVEVVSQSTSSKDVTEEYVDLTAKLSNLEATEQQLLRIMEKAERVEDILNIQRELSATRQQIERTKARMQYLERTSDTSLIEVSLEQSKLDVKLSASRRNVKQGENIRFDVEIAGGFTPYSYKWEFGDGETSTSASPIHTYRSAGTYSVSVTVTDDRGNTDDETRSEYITVLPGWSAGSVVSGAWSGLVTFGHALANILIWLGVFSPVWIIAGVIFILWRRRRAKRTKA